MTLGYGDILKTQLGKSGKHGNLRRVIFAERLPATQVIKFGCDQAWGLRGEDNRWTESRIRSVTISTGQIDVCRGDLVEMGGGSCPCAIA